jgi:hypothetical protein
MLPSNAAVFSIRHGIFWILFLLTGALLFFRFPWTEVLLGALAVMLGISQLEREIEEKRARENEKPVRETLEEIREWIQREYEFVKSMEARYDNRFFQSNRKRAELGRKMERAWKEADRKTEKNYRELVKKILEVENRMSKMSRAFLEKPPRSGRGKDVFK